MSIFVGKSSFTQVLDYYGVPFLCNRCHAHGNLARHCHFPFNCFAKNYYKKESVDGPLSRKHRSSSLESAYMDSQEVCFQWVSPPSQNLTTKVMVEDVDTSCGNKTTALPPMEIGLKEFLSKVPTMVSLEQENTTHSGAMENLLLEKGMRMSLISFNLLRERLNPFSVNLSKYYLNTSR